MHESIRLTSVSDQEHIAPGHYLIQVEFLDPWATFHRSDGPLDSVGVQLEPQAAVDLALRLIVVAAPDLALFGGCFTSGEARALSNRLFDVSRSEP